MTIYSYKLKYYQKLDEKASTIARNLKGGTSSENEVSCEIMKVIIDLYKAAKVEQNFSHDVKFQSAYHSPITSEFEFFISRILFHFSEINHLNWKILLRKQQQKTAPDIRIERDGNTLAIIEIKAKAGWIQPFLSSERFAYDMERLRDNKTMFDPNDLIKKSKAQLDKYRQTFRIENKNIYFLLPTLTLVHRKRYRDKQLYDYTEYFKKNSGLPTDNLVLLSKNMLLDLSNAEGIEDLDGTGIFARMIYRIKQL